MPVPLTRELPVAVDNVRKPDRTGWTQCIIADMILRAEGFFMKRWYFFGFAIGLGLISAGCSETPAPVPDTRAADERSIREGEIAWNADFKAKDVDRLMSHYADAATLMAPGAPVAKGRDAIRASLNGMLADKNMAITFSASMVEVAKGGDMAYSQGTYALTTTNPKTRRPVNEKGTYVTVYKKQAGGDWKAVEDINTPEALPIQAASPKKKPTAKAARRRK
jgi:uncharacterized protein (TIGR02246 family)